MSLYRIIRAWWRGHDDYLEKSIVKAVHWVNKRRGPTAKQVFQIMFVYRYANGSHQRRASVAMHSVFDVPNTIATQRELDLLIPEFEKWWNKR